MWFSKKKKATTSPLNGIQLTFEDTNLGDKLRIDVIANGVNIGYINRGQLNGYWFISTLGEDIYMYELDELKEKLHNTLEKYRVFFYN